MPRHPSPAAATGLPSATILVFQARAAEPFRLSHKDWMKAFVAISVSAQFVDMDEDDMDLAMLEMIETIPSSVERMVRENGEVLADLRKAVAFLAALDLRIGASAARVLDGRAC